MTETFYTVLGGVAFTIYGLWWVVVQSKPDWRVDRARRMLAYVVSLHFVLPGMMSLLSIVAPEQPALWQIVFAATGALGVAVVALLVRALRDEHDSPSIVRVIQWVVLPIYVIVTVVALIPTLPAQLGLGLSGLQTEAIVVTLIFLWGLQSAWLLMIEPPRIMASPAEPPLAEPPRAESPRAEPPGVEPPPPPSAPRPEGGA